MSVPAMPPSATRPSVRGNRLCLLSHGRARRLAEKRRSQPGALNEMKTRSLHDAPNPHYGYRRETPEYKESLARSHEETLTLLRAGIAQSFMPGRMPDERGRLLLEENSRKTNVDGTIILLLAFLSRLWPNKPTLADVLDAVFTNLDQTERFPPITDERRAYITRIERKIDRRMKKMGVTRDFSEEQEKPVAEALHKACELVGWDNDTLRSKAEKNASEGASATDAEDYTAIAQEEYIGFMSLLASVDVSVHSEPEEDGSDGEHFVYPRRELSRQRFRDLLSKIHGGTLQLNEDGPPTWHKASKTAIPNDYAQMEQMDLLVSASQGADKSKGKKIIEVVQGCDKEGREGEKEKKAEGVVYADADAGAPPTSL